MASLSGAEGGPEEPELSITLTLRMLMHGKVTAGNWGVWGGGAVLERPPPGDEHLREVSSPPS